METFLAQYFRLLIIFVKLKSWKLLFMAVVIAAMFSNHFLYYQVGSLLNRLGEKSYQVIGAEEFQRDNIVLGNIVKYVRQIKILSDYVTDSGAKSDFIGNLRNCQSESECRDTYLRLLATSDQLVHLVEYESSIGNRTKLWCQISLGNELYCPYMAYLVSISQSLKTKENNFYNKTNVFKLMDFAPNESQLPDKRASSICTKQIEFLEVYPKTLLIQEVLIITTLTFYIFICTITCIYELKRCGYLQLMVRRGLSVFAYWLSLWTITLIEMAIFAMALGIAFETQCPSYFAIQSLQWLFLQALLQFCCLASLLLLPTVLTRRIDVAGLISCIIWVLAVAIAAFKWFAPDLASEYDKYMLALPTPHLIDQILETLLGDSMKPQSELTWIILPLSAGVWLVMTILTMYLDCVLKSGNGLRLTFLYPACPKLCCRCLSTDSITPDLPSSILAEEASPKWNPIVHIRNLTKTFSTCCSKRKPALNKFSANFYEDQITAVVGHNGSGKSTLMQILSGVRNATSGRAYMDKIQLTSSLSRYHIRRCIGYCPQVDALVDRLTVSDTLKLAALSSGRKWSDVEGSVRDVLTSLDLVNSMDATVRSLSISQRRKVSITQALVGNPRLILLDDPCGSMDDGSKKQLWQLLHRLKTGRCIIVSSQCIDEAEAVADRTMFMSTGRLICSGSTYFFKRVFDCAYIIQIASKTEHHVAFIIERIVSKVQFIRARSIIGPDIELEVPISEYAALPEVVRQIESLPRLIDEFGIRICRLDDVFNKFKDWSAEEIQDQIARGTISNVAEDQDRAMAIYNKPRRVMVPDDHVVVRRSKCSWLKAILALLLVNFIQIFRSKVRLLVRVIVPLIFLAGLVGACLLENSTQNSSKGISYHLSDTQHFERNRGLCLHFFTLDLSAGHYEVVHRGECGYFISGDRRSDFDVKGLKIDPKYKGKSLEELLILYLGQIRKKCDMASSACPIAYSTDWCPDIDISLHHQVYVGAYVKRDNYTADKIAMTAIEVFRNMVFYITNQTSLGQSAIQPEFDTVAFQDIRTIHHRPYGLAVQLAMLIVLPIIFIADILHDKRKGVQIQLLSLGVSRCQYWVCNAVSHWLQFAVIYSIGIVIQVLILWTVYVTEAFLLVIMTPTLIFGLLNNLLCVYILGVVIGRNKCVPIATYILVCLLILLSLPLVQLHHLLSRMFIFLCPQFATIALPFFGVRFMFYSAAFYLTTEGKGRHLTPADLAANRHVTDCLIMLPVHFVLLTLLLVIIETRHRLLSVCRQTGIYAVENDAYQNSREGEMGQEFQALSRVPLSSQNMMGVFDLRVVGPRRNVLLRNISFRLQSGEALGLVGPSESSLKVAVRAIVGTEKYTCAGEVEVRVDNQWISNIDAAQRGRIGYCPDYYPIYKRLTVRENLNFYARVTGVPAERVRQLLAELQLSASVGTVVMRATTAVKRRLVLAIALLASPVLLAIEDISTGIDSHGRHLLIDIIRSQKRMRRGILMASQHLENCESLCDQVCVINNGLIATMDCIGDFLKRYNKIYLLEIQLYNAEERQNGDIPEVEIADVIERVCKRFPGAQVLESFKIYAQFIVDIRSLHLLSNSLDWLVANKSSLSIRHFALHYASIDQTLKAIVKKDINRRDAKNDESDTLI